VPSLRRSITDALAAPKELAFYWRIAPVTRAETRDLLGSFDVDLKDRTVLDLGPAIGSSLAVFRERGARCSFIERHPLFYAACRSRGFAGKLGDFLRHPELIEGALDVVYVRGSVSPSSFATEADLRSWVTDVKARTDWLFLCPWLGAPAPSWFGPVLDELLEPHQILGVSTPIYPFTWVAHS
jgi:hypothetical protein